MTLLSVDAVVKSFAGVVALDHVSFEVGEGELVGIMGANGAGKTTLFSVIAGNLRANDGAITFDGRRIDGLRPDQIKPARRRPHFSDRAPLRQHDGA